MAGWVQSVEGGNATSDVVVEKLGPDHIQRKHLAGVKYEDIAIHCGAEMSKAFFDWIKATVGRSYTRKNGAIGIADYNLKETARMSWVNRLISEIGFPALDAASKDVARLSLKFAPEYTRWTQGAGAVTSPGKAAMEKKWLSSNFRLQIAGLDCTRVNKIEAFTIKQAVVTNAVGELRNYEKEPAHLEVPNLVITMAESSSSALYKWHEDFVIKGNNGQNAEKSGLLEYLSPDSKTAYFSLALKNLGIFKLTPEKVEAGSENIRRVKAEIYCEDVQFAYSNLLA